MNPLLRGIVYSIVPMMAMMTLSCERLSLIPIDDSNEPSSALLYQLSITSDTGDNFFTDKALDLLNVNSPRRVVHESFVYERKAVPGYDVLSLLITDTTTSSITLKGQVTSQIVALEAERFFFDSNGIKKIKHSFVEIKPDKRFEKQLDITQVNNNTRHPEPMLLRFKQVNGITRSIQILPVYNGDKASKHVYDYIGALREDDQARYSRWERNVDVDIKNTLQYTFTIYYDPDFISEGNPQMYEWALTSGFLRRKSLIHKRTSTRINSDDEWTHTYKYKTKPFTIDIPQDNPKNENRLSEYTFKLKFEPLFIKKLNIKPSSPSSSVSIPVLDGVLKYPSNLGFLEGVDDNTGITAQVLNGSEKKLVTDGFTGGAKGDYLYSVYNGENIVNSSDSLQGNEELLITPYTDSNQFSPDVASRIVKRYKFREGYEPTLNLYGNKVSITYKGASAPLLNTPNLTGLTPFTSIYINEKTSSIILFHSSSTPLQLKDIAFKSSESVVKVTFDDKRLTLTLLTGEGSKEYNVTVVANNATIKISDVSFDVGFSQGLTNFGATQKNVIIDDKTIVLILPYGLSVDDLSSKFAKVEVTVLSDDKHKPLHGVKLESDTIKVNNTTSPPTFGVYSAVVKNKKLITSKSNAHKLKIYLGNKKTTSVEYTILAGTIGLTEAKDDIVADDNNNKCFKELLAPPIIEASLEKFIQSKLHLAYTIEGTETYIGNSRKSADKVNTGVEIKGEIKIFLSDTDTKSFIIKQGLTEKRYKIQTFGSGTRICL